MSTRACHGCSATGHCKFGEKCRFTYNVEQLEKTPSLEPSATSIQSGNRNTTLRNGPVCHFFTVDRRSGESCRWSHVFEDRSSSNDTNRAGNIDDRNNAGSDERNKRESGTCTKRGKQCGTTEVELEFERQTREAQLLAERKMKKVEIAEHDSSAALRHIVMDGSMLVTCGAGLDIQHFVCGFDSCFVTIKNLPRNVKRHEIEELVTEQGVDTTFFCVIKMRYVNDEVEVKIMSDSVHGQVIATYFDGLDFQDKVLDTAIDNGGVGTVFERNAKVLTINAATHDLHPTPRSITRGGEEASRQTVGRLMDESRVGIKSETRDSKHAACPICFDDATTPVILTCGHFYCTACLCHFLSSAVERKSFPLVCSGNEDRCKTPIAIPIIQRYLLQQQFDRLVDMAVTTYIEKQPTKFKYCRTPDCPQVYHCEGGDMVLTCPSCFATVCSGCHKEAHKGMTCREREIMTSPKKQERLNEEWALASGAKRCPSCRVLIQKTEGCNHMTCRCGVHLCWLCLRSFPDGPSVYAHMNTIHGRINGGGVQYAQMNGDRAHRARLRRLEAEGRVAGNVRRNRNWVLARRLGTERPRAERVPEHPAMFHNVEEQQQRRVHPEARRRTVNLKLWQRRAAQEAMARIAGLGAHQGAAELGAAERETLQRIEEETRQRRAEQEVRQREREEEVRQRRAEQEIDQRVAAQQALQRVLAKEAWLYVGGRRQRITMQEAWQQIAKQETRARETREWRNV